MRLPRPPILTHWLLALVLSLFAALLFFLQDHTPVAEKLKVLQVRHVPSELLSYNKLGELFHKMGATTIIPNHSFRYKQQFDQPEMENIGPFQKRRQISGALIGIGEEHELMRAAAANLKKAVNDDNITISVVTEAENIDGEHGILTNYQQRGKKAERLAYAAIQKGDTLLQQSAVGFRLHGGTSRDPSLPKHSYRLYFRKIYGSQWLDVAEIFPKLAALRTLVVHDDIPDGWPLSNVIANDLYAMAGVNTTEYSQAEFILNGVDQGLVWLSPHLSKKYLRQKYNLESMHFHRYRGDKKNSVFWEDMDKLSTDATLTYEKVRGVIDIEGLMNYFIAVTFSGNTDWSQGVAFKDAKDDSSTWQWVAWDLDHCFTDWYASRSRNPEREVWQQEGLGLIFKEKLHRLGNSRLRLFRRLFIEDPSFEDYFIRRYVQILNHDLSPQQLAALYRKYEIILEKYDRESNPELLRFFQNRHGHIRYEMRHFFGLPEFQQLHVESDIIPEILVDSYPETLPYTGHYPGGMEVVVELPPKHDSQAGHWLVDGKKAAAGKVTISLQKKTTIRWVEQ